MVKAADVKAFQGLGDDARSKRGIFARGFNVYGNGTQAATTGHTDPGKKAPVVKSAANLGPGPSMPAAIKNAVQRRALNKTGVRKQLPAQASSVAQAAVTENRAKNALKKKTLAKNFMDRNAAIRRLASK